MAEERNPQHGLADSPGAPELPNEWIIERMDTHSRHARSVSDWLDYWKKLQSEGWQITVLIGSGTAVGFGYRRS